MVDMYFVVVDTNKMDILDNTSIISCYIHRKKKENKKHNKEDVCLSELWLHLESIIKIKHLHYVGVLIFV